MTVVALAFHAVVFAAVLAAVIGPLQPFTVVGVTAACATALPLGRRVLRSGAGLSPHPRKDAHDAN